MKKGSGPFFRKRCQGAYAQNCPVIDPEKQRSEEAACRAAGGAWARHGVRDHPGKPCRNRAECEHLCVTEHAPRIGAEAEGRCSAVKTSFGCFTHLDGGRIVGRVCVE